jgi:hypothetical protein
MHKSAWTKGPLAQRVKGIHGLSALRSQPAARVQVHLEPPSKRQPKPSCGLQRVGNVGGDVGSGCV